MSGQADILVEVSEVWKSFDSGKVEVLKGVSLNVAKGEIVALCGNSGCGKTTLLHLISGLESPDRGLVRVAGTNVLDEKSRIGLLRHRIGHVFQLHHLMPDLSLEENLMVPVVAVGGSRADALKRMNELAEATGISHRLSRRVRELSGGERQRGALVRALMNDPDVLLCDEPTGALDEANREAVFELLLKLAKSRGRALVMATHDLALARRCDRFVVMRDGRIVEGGSNEP